MWVMPAQFEKQYSQSLDGVKAGQFIARKLDRRKIGGSGRWEVADLRSAAARTTDE